MGRLNGLYCEYSDWFKRQQRSFLFDIKSMQVVVPTLVSQRVQTIKDLRGILEMGHTLVQAGRGVGSVQRLEQFIKYWDQLCELRCDLDNLWFELNGYVVSITSLRDPEAKVELDKMYDTFTYQCSETYKFTNMNNAKDNLYTYGLSMPDQDFLGLVGYLPHLLKKSISICFRVSTKIHIEKE